jgi:hypothetical protein
MHVMKLIDCFCYNGEPIVELRLEYLSRVVDKFVVTEARYTHAGNRKDHLFVEENAELFARFNVDIVVVDAFPPVPEGWRSPHDSFVRSESRDAWFREQHQRQAGVDHVKRTTQGPYVLLCSDADEIPRQEISELKTMYGRLHRPVYLEMDFLYYNFRWAKKYTWAHAFAISDAGVSDVDINEVRVRPVKDAYISKAGWHFSYFGTIADLARKVASFAHRECDTPRAKDPAFAVWCIAYGKDLFGRPGEDMVHYTGDLPAGWEKIQSALEEAHLKEIEQKMV